VETYFHYVSSSTRQTTASGNKVDTCIRFVSALLYLEWGLEVTNPIVSISTFCYQDQRPYK
jgi:hypothetical protein